MSATTVILALPHEVLQRALRVAWLGMSAAAIVPALAVPGAALDDYREAAEAAAHEGELQPCPRCQREGHWARWRGYPVLDPGPCPPGGVLGDVTAGCWCCFWGGGPSGLDESIYHRLSREAHGGRDVQVEHFDRRRDRFGRRRGWTKFETRF